MTFLTFCGAFFTAYAIPIVLGCKYAHKHAPLLLVFLAGALIFILASLSNAIVWFMIPPLKDTYAWLAILSVLFQEGFRYLLFLLYRKTERLFGLQESELMAHTKLADIPVAIAGGLGYGVANSVVSYASMLGQALNSGTYYDPRCGSMNFFLVIALLVNVSQIFNILWMILGFYSFRKHSWTHFLLLTTSHFFAALMTLHNDSVGGCEVVFAVQYVHALLLLAYVMYFAKKQLEKQS